VAGSPIKHERNRLVREAILRGVEEGKSPVEFIEPFTAKLKEMALAGDMSAMRELFDRLDGKPAQAVTVAGDSENPLAIVHESR